MDSEVMVPRVAGVVTLILALASGDIQAWAEATKLEAGIRDVAGAAGRAPQAGEKTSAIASLSPWAQEFPELRVEVVRLIADPRQISVFLRYENKTEEELYLALDAPKGGGRSSRAVSEHGVVMDMVNPVPDQSYLLDSEGNRYQFMSASGLAGGWYGEACRQSCWETGTTLLVLPPKETTTASLRFQVTKDRRQLAQKVSYELVSAQVLVMWPTHAAGDLTKAVAGKSIGISIRNIEPR